MAYVLRYKLEFDDIHHLHPAKWKVEISKRTEGATVTGVFPLIGGDTPLKITRGKQSDDKMEPMLGSEVQIGVVLTDDIPTGARPYFTKPLEPTDFFTIDETELKVEIYKDNVLKWVGFCKPDYCEYQYTSKPYGFTIVATDRIALLKSKLVGLSDVKSDTGYFDVITLLKESGLYNTDTCDKLKVLSSERYMTDVTTFENKKVRYELMVDNNGNAVNIYDSLVSIATSFGARLFYEDGTFWFQRIEDLMTENCKVQSYTSGTSVQETNTVAIRKIIKGEISSSNAIYAGNQIGIHIAPAHKQEKADINYKFRGWLQNFDWTEWDGSDFAHWNKEFSNEVIQRHGSGSFDDPYVMYFEKYSSGTGTLFQWFDGIPNGASFNLKTKIKFLKTNIMAFRFLIATTLPGNPYQNVIAAYNAKSGNWDTTSQSDGDHHIHQQRQDDSNEIEVNITLPSFNFPWNILGIQYPPNFDPNDTYTLIFEIIDPDGSVSEASIYNGMEVSDVVLSLNGSGYTGEIDTIRTDKEYSTLEDVDHNDLIDGSVYVANSVYEGAAPTNGSWHSDYFGYATKLQSLALYSRLNIFQKPYKVMQGQFFSNDISFQHVLQQAFGDYSLFIQMYDEYDVRKCIHNMMLAEINHGQINLSGVSSVTKYKHD